MLSGIYNIPVIAKAYSESNTINFEFLSNESGNWTVERSLTTDLLESWSWGFNGYSHSASQGLNTIYVQLIGLAPDGWTGSNYTVYRPGVNPPDTEQTLAIGHLSNVTATPYHSTGYNFELHGTKRYSLINNNFCPTSQSDYWGVSSFAHNKVFYCATDNKTYIAAQDNGFSNLGMEITDRDVFHPLKMTSTVSSGNVNYRFNHVLVLLENNGRLELTYFEFDFNSGNEIVTPALEVIETFEMGAQLSYGITHDTAENISIFWADESGSDIHRAYQYNGEWTTEVIINQLKQPKIFRIDSRVH